MGNSKIFIQIASYRDPQLTPTIRDCINNAVSPENLRFCIAWQHSEDENLDELKAISGINLNVIDIPYLNSRGACWARSQIQSRYTDEEYTLQLDSHHRFAPHWDEKLITMFNQLKGKGYKKPLLTTYAPSYDPNNDPQARILSPWRMDFDRFIPEGAIFFLPAMINGWEKLTEPVPARFYSAHMCFTSGQFCLEVPHDPQYYFHGEEISIAVRAFTHGYDLFHPHQTVIWHEYTRVGRPKHWDDHNGNVKIALPDGKHWGERNTECHLRNRKLFSMDGERYDSIDWGRYGFGTERTLRDYEKYAGILFSKRAVQQDVIDKKYPPSDLSKYKSDAEWIASFTTIFKHCIDINRESVTAVDYDFWCIVFEREDGTPMFRQDADSGEVTRVMAGSDPFIKIWREFLCEGKPHHWVVWPHSKSQGWCTKLSGKL